MFVFHLYPAIFSKDCLFCYMDYDKKQLLSEVTYKYVRASGAGGQHVNKVSSKVISRWSISSSSIFTALQKERLITNLSHRLTVNQELILESDHTRSQLKNKEMVVERLLNLIDRALIVPKIRKATHTPKAIIEKRLNVKKRKSTLKSLRSKPMDY